MAQIIKHLPAVQKTWVLSLGYEDILEKEMATHSCILAWEILWTEEPDVTFHGDARVGHNLATEPLPPWSLTVWL